MTYIVLNNSVSSSFMSAMDDKAGSVQSVVSFFTVLAVAGFCSNKCSAASCSWFGYIWRFRL